MNCPDDPFELEPADDGPSRRPRKKVDAEPAGTTSRPFDLEPVDSDAEAEAPAPGAEVEGGDERPSKPGKAPAAVYVPPEPVDIDEVDERTVAEKAGAAVPRSTQPLGNPPDWPREALAFPKRRPGPGFMAAGILVLFAFDLAGLVQAFVFPAWVAKLLVLVYLLRAQFKVIGSSAAGYDDPRDWHKALQFDRSDLSQYWRTLLMFSGALAPGTLLFVFEHIGWGIALLVVGSMYASVVALGAALRDPALKWPWRALAWMTTRPLHCLLGSASWWVLIATELVVHGLRNDGPVLVGFVSLALRFACLYLMLVSARIIGVMGRRWGGASTES